MRQRPLIWLDTGRVRLPAITPKGAVYRIDFIGRRTRYRVPSGHMGVFDYEIIVDRVIAIRPIR
jgi:hypothetical protein